MFEKIWIARKNSASDRRIANVPDFISDILAKRGIVTEEEVKNFLDPTVDKLTDPFLLADMDRAVERILTACDNGEHITIYGDYDADGITSTTVLYHFFTNFLGADVDYYVPNRLTEGYGLSESAIDVVSERGSSLIVTVDCGISSIDEVKYAIQHDIDVVITDHHKCGDILPDCYAVVNPMRPDSSFPYRTLAGVGVAFKLIEALAAVIGLGEEVLEYLPIVAVGTVGDSMPLTGENRIIVSNGLKNIDKSAWVGLKKLIEQSKGKTADSKLSSFDMAFGVVPRINAAGRMGDADIALRLLLCEDESEAQELAAILSQKNTERQKVETAIAEEALKPENLKTKETDSFVLSLGYEWHHGVIGIVASRLMEKFSKPAIVLSCCAEECTDGVMRARGSARSVPGFDLYGALKANSDLLERFGGHEMAAGLTIDIDNIEAFIDGVNKYATENKIELPIFQTYEIDAFLPVERLNVETAEAVARLEPFGQGNPCPMFCTVGFGALQANKVGDGGKHLKMRFIHDDGARLVGTDGILFNGGDYYSIASGIDKCSCIYNIEINEWQGRKNVSLRVLDIVDDRYPENDNYISAYTESGSEYYTGNCFRLTHKELTALFKVIKSFGDRFSFDDLFKVRKILIDNDYSFTWFKLRHGIDIFCELGFIRKIKEGLYEFVKDVQNRSLDDSAIYRELKRS